MAQVVTRFNSCLGVLRHALNDSEIITGALTDLGVRHDRHLYFVEDVAEEDRFAALRLLQVCRV
jgi:hypothetical protein